MANARTLTPPKNTLVSKPAWQNEVMEKLKAILGYIVNTSITPLTPPALIWRTVFLSNTIILVVLDSSVSEIIDCVSVM